MSMRVQLGRVLRRLRSRGMRGSAMNTRPSLRYGLPYGWWRNPDVWVTVFSAVTIAATGVIVLAGWFR